MEEGLYNYKNPDINSEGKSKTIFTIFVLSILFTVLISFGLTQVLHSSRLAAFAHTCPKPVARKVLQYRILRADIFGQYDVLLLGDKKFIEQARRQIPDDYVVRHVHFNTSGVKEISSAAKALKTTDADYIIAQSPFFIWTTQLGNQRAPIIDFWKLDENKGRRRFVNFSILKQFFDDVPKCLNDNWKTPRGRNIKSKLIPEDTIFDPQSHFSSIRGNLLDFRTFEEGQNRKVIFAMQSPDDIRTKDETLKEMYRVWMNDGNKVAGTGDKVLETQLSTVFE